MNAAADRLSKKFIGAVEDEWPVYSDRTEDYTIGLPIGFGASSTVYAATYHRPTPTGPQSIPCAVKVLDLDKLPPHSLSLLQRETTLMSLSKHPNVLRVRGTWVDGHKLYIAMRLMNKGSAADVMRFAWSGGMEEEVVKCILKQALQGLNYLHVNGFIHRDVKAANLLIDDDGTVLLGDLGVAASLCEDDGHHANHNATPQVLKTVNADPNAIVSRTTGTTPPRLHVGKRRSFVGTPCWMAPEIINGKRYDSSADIWSFGITAIELAEGRAPRSRDTPHNVLLHTVQDEPPKLDRTGGVHKYSRAFEELVASCLVKDPSKRPAAAQLLQTLFFRGAKKPSYLVGTILKGLPPLTQRQERRRQPSIMTHRSIDSWDFSVTHPSSPVATTIGSRGASHDLPAPPWLGGEEHHRHHSKTQSHSHLGDVELIMESESEDGDGEEFDLSGGGLGDEKPNTDVPLEFQPPYLSSDPDPEPLSLPPAAQSSSIPPSPASSPSASSSALDTSSTSDARGESGSGSASPSLDSITPSTSTGSESQPPGPSSGSPKKGEVQEPSPEKQDKEKDKEGGNGGGGKKRSLVGRVLRRNSASGGSGSASEAMRNALARTGSRLGR